MKRIYALAITFIFVLALSISCTTMDQKGSTTTQTGPKGAEQRYQEFWGRGKATYEHGQALQKQADELKKTGHADVR